MWPHFKKALPNISAWIVIPLISKFIIELTTYLVPEHTDGFWHISSVLLRISSSSSVKQVLNFTLHGWWRILIKERELNNSILISIIILVYLTTYKSYIFIGFKLFDSIGIVGHRIGFTIVSFHDPCDFTIVDTIINMTFWT